MTYFRPEIEAMAGYVPGEQPQDGKFIKLNTNENPYPPSPKVVRAIQQAAESGLMRYPDPMGNAFRDRAAGILGVQPDWILCGNGSDDILTIVTRALVGPGQLLRLPYPSYILYKTLAELQGAGWEEVRFCDDWCLPPEFAAAAADLRLVFLPNPNSPSGTVVPRDAILELAEQLPCPLLVDEAYVDFADENCMDLVAQEREDHGLADAEQVVRPGRSAVRLPGRSAAADRAVHQGQGLLQLRRPVDRRGDGGHRRPGVAAADRGQDSWPPAAGWPTECKAWALPSCLRRRISSGVPIQSMQPSRSTSN